MILNPLCSPSCPLPPPPLALLTIPLLTLPSRHAQTVRSVVGTVDWMAPEVILGEPYNFKVRSSATEKFPGV